jgi:hypothetical protein
MWLVMTRPEKKLKSQGYEKEVSHVSGSMVLGIYLSLVLLGMVALIMWGISVLV